MDKNLVFQGFKKTLVVECGAEEGQRIWQEASRNYAALKAAHSDLDSDSRMLILPAAAIYQAEPECLLLLWEYAAELGSKIGKVVHGLTSIPGVSRLLWANMPKIMRRASSPGKGYERRIVSETRELVGVDILSCPLCNAAQKIGVPEVASVICAMDKAYMTGFKYIDYTRTTALGEGDAFCDYRLRFDPTKK